MAALSHFVRQRWVRVTAYLLVLIALVGIFVAFAFFRRAKETLPASTPESPVTQRSVEMTVNGVTMKLLTAHTEGIYYRVEVCYSLPSQQDWLLTSPNSSQGTYLSFLDKKAISYEEGTMYWRYDAEGNPKERCEYLYFRAKVPEQVETLSLRVGALYARQTGQPDYCLEISQKMVERGYTVAISCAPVKGIEGQTYEQFPIEALVMDPAYSKIVKQMMWDRHDGPWQFTFPINPR